MAIGIVKFIKGLLIQSETDGTKQLQVEVSSSATTGTKTTIQAAQTANRTVVLPDASDTLVAKATTDTLSNKTLDNTNTLNIKDTLLTLQDDGNATKQARFQLSGITAGQTRTVTLPDADITLFGATDTQTLSNKTLDNTNTITVKDNLLTVQDDGDVTKQVRLQVSGVSTGTTRTLSVPDADTTIVGTDASQTLSNKTLNNTNIITVQDSSLTIQDNGDATKQLKIEVSGITTATTRTLTAPDANTTIVGTDASQTLTNKTISGAANTITNVSLSTGVTGTLPIGSGGTGQITNTLAFNALSPLTTKADIITRNSTDNIRLGVGSDGQVLVADSAQTSGLKWAQVNGIKNYISNSDAEATANGYNAYADAAQATPVDGTGGSPSVTITRTTSSPLRGVGSFLITKDAVNRQGQGASTDFTIDSADQAKPLQISFDYTIASGTYSGGTSSTDSDIAVYIYDVTNALIIQPAGFKLDGGVVGVNYSCKANFQSSSNSTSYRLILHCATTSSSAFTLKFDNVVVSPVVYSVGAALTDWQSYTLTGAFTTNTTYTGTYKRIGDSLDIEFTLSFAGAPNSISNLRINLPSGLSIDSTKTSAAATKGAALIISGGVGSTGQVRLHTGGTLTAFQVLTNSGGQVTQSSPGTFTSGDVIRGFITGIPISGFSSNSIVSSDTDTRIVALSIGGDPASAASGNPIIFPTTIYDTHGGYNASTGRYTVPVAGYYRVHGYTNGDVPAITIKIYKNAVAGPNLGVTMPTYFATPLSGTVLCAAGDILDVRPDGTYNAAPTSYVYIERLSGPGQIAASEDVIAKYSFTATQNNVLNTGVVSVIDFSFKVIDTHNAVTIGVGAWTPSSGGNATSNWKFTAPISGVYQVSSSILMDSSSAWAAGERIWMRLYKNGAINSYLHFSDLVSVTGFNSAKGTDLVKLVAGDTLAIIMDQTSGSNIAMYSGADNNQANYVNIVRVGN